MNMIQRIAPLFVVITFSGCLFEKEIDVMHEINSAQDIVALFPTSTEALKKLVSSTLATCDQEISAIIAVPNQEKNFKNTARAFDTTNGRMARLGGILSVIMNTNQDAGLRAAAQEGLIEQANFSVEKLVYNKPLFKALEYYITNKSGTENLNEEEKYFLTQTMNNAQKNGLFLSDNEQATIKEFIKELTKLEIDFNNNINNALQEIPVEESALEGLSPEAINSLKTKTEHGITYRILNTTYPVVTNVLEHCSVEETRKKIWHAFANRAYPTNDALLQNIITLRHKLAQSLHYPSYAHYDIHLMMAQTPENVKKFLESIEQRAIKKGNNEIKEFVKDLPAGVTLTKDGLIKPWDFGYIKSWYKKKNYKLDSRYIAEFFPVESTLENIFKIYETFLGLTFEKVPVAGAWDKDVTAIAIRQTPDKKILGYLLLDLFPRPNKYTHACFSGLTPSLKTADGTRIPGSGVVIANFPHATPTQPALLKHEDVVVFFHEFGHAIHAILGATELASFSGTNVKDDFVETPSQMFEEWMWTPEIIQSISKHYKTGEHLPQNVIDVMVKLKNFDSGNFVCRQLALTNMSLDYFTGINKNLQSIMFDYYTKLQPRVQLIPENHSYASFGHLASGNYGSKYYNYLWSKFYALDLFESIKEQGLLNPAVGTKLVQSLLGRGGSCPPQNCLHDFLGREPRSDAFFRNLGM